MKDESSISAHIGEFVGGVITLLILGGFVAHNWPAIEQYLGAKHVAAVTVADASPAAKSLTEQQMLRRVDYTVTPARVAGNPQKYLGNYVLFACTIKNVVSQGDDKVANAECHSPGDAPDSIGTYDDDTTLILSGSVGDFDANEKLLVLGSVDEPVEGSNTMGADMQFPNVRVIDINPRFPTAIAEAGSSDSSHDGDSSGQAVTTGAQSSDGSSSDAGQSDASQQNAVQIVQSYYDLWNGEKYQAMYAMLSPAMQRKYPYESYERFHKLVHQIHVEASAVDSTTVNVHLVTHDEDVNTGKVSVDTTDATWHLVQTPQGFLLDDEDVHPGS